MVDRDRKLLDASGRGTMHSHLPGTPHTAVTEAAELSETTAQNSDSNTQNRGATTKCISHSNSPTSVVDSGSTINKSNHITKMYNSESETSRPKFMTGYGGHQPHLGDELELPKIISTPVVGYTGSYRGKNLGKLGRCEVHRTRVSAWENETVSGILGVPTVHDDWEFSHYTNSCGNFNEKKFHESTSVMRSPSRSPNGAFNALDSGSIGSLAASAELAFSCSSPDAQFRDRSRQPSETDKTLLHIQKHLEYRFKTSADARSVLKSAFFGLDRTRRGLISASVFFGVLRRIAGVSLSEEQCADLTIALHYAGQRKDPHHITGYALGSEKLEEEEEGGGGGVRNGGASGYGSAYGHDNDNAEHGNVDEVNYGRFLNILVPRSSPGAGKAAT